MLALVLIIVTLVGRDLRLAGSAGSNAAQASEIIDTGALRPLDGLTRVTLSAFRYNRVTGAFLGSATLTNTGPASLAGPLYLVAESVTPAGARITNATGVTASGQPYFNVSGLLTAGALAPGASARPQNLTIGVTSAVPVAVTLRAYGPPVHVNRPPQAEAGADQTAYVGQTLTLDGSHSVDPDGDPLSFSWSLVSRPTGSAAQLIGPGLVNPSFQVDRSGSYSIRLVVNDGSLDSAPDTVTASTLNSRPTANAGANRTARVGDTVTLDGSGSSDADADPLSFQWSLLSRPDGSTAGLLDADRTLASLLPDLPGLYVIQLIVNDGHLASDPGTARIEVIVGNGPPRLTSAAPVTAILGVPYRYAAQAQDPDDDPLRYSLPSAPAGMTIDPATGLVQWTPAAGQTGPHQVSLRVQDPAGASDTQGYTLTVVANCTALPPGSAGACAITGLSVDHAQPGSELTIHGYGYGFDPDPAKNRVRIGGAETDVIAIGPDGIRVRVPLTATDGHITVETPRGTMTGPAFTIDRAQDFALAASPAAIDLPQGARRVVQVQVGDAGSDPYQGLVELAVGTLPAGVSVEILPPTLTAGRPGTLLISAAQTASPGRYGIQVDGTGYTSGIRQTRGAGFILVLRIDSTPADPGYPIFPVSVTIADDRMTQLDDWVLRHQPPAERFSPIVPNSPQDQVITDPRLPGVEVRLLAGTSIIGWDGVPKTRMAIERIEPDRLPVDPPLQGASPTTSLPPPSWHRRWRYGSPGVCIPRDAVHRQHAAGWCSDRPSPRQVQSPQGRIKSVQRRAVHR